MSPISHRDPRNAKDPRPNDPLFPRRKVRNVPPESPSYPESPPFARELLRYRFGPIPFRGAIGWNLPILRQTRGKNELSGRAISGPGTTPKTRKLPRCAHVSHCPIFAHVTYDNSISPLPRRSPARGLPSFSWPFTKMRTVPFAGCETKPGRRSAPTPRLYPRPISPRHTYPAIWY